MRSHSPCGALVVDIIVVVAQNIEHIVLVGCIPMLAQSTTELHGHEGMGVSSQDKHLQGGPYLDRHCFPILELLHREHTQLKEEMHSVVNELRLGVRILTKNHHFLALLKVLEEAFGSIVCVLSWARMSWTLKVGFHP
jgi:hypothetical protein